MPTQPLVPSIRADELEPHVLTALKGSRNPSGIDADEALRSALSVMEGGTAFQKLRNILKERNLEAPPAEPEGTEDGCELSAPFAQSLRIAWSVVPDRKQIWGRALLTAALFDPRAHEAEWLQGRLDSVREDWAAFLKTDEAKSWPQWEEALDEYRERATTQGPGDSLTQAISFRETADDQTQVAAALAGFSGDAVPPEVGPDDDRLQIGSEVNALASVVAARDVKPPLSVALFGDWGVGKSFFMRQMRSRVAPDSDGGQDFREGQVPVALPINWLAWHRVCPSCSIPKVGALPRSEARALGPAGARRFPAMGGLPSSSTRRTSPADRKGPGHTAMPDLVEALKCHLTYTVQCT